MQKPPLSVIKAWPKPNYINPATRGNANLMVNIVLFSLLFIFISLRIFTRTYLRSVFGADDVFILLAMIPTTAFFVISVLADAKFLWIRHVYDIPPDAVTLGLKMVLAAQLVFAAACTLTKLSMLMLVRRMLSNSSLFWRRITLAAITLVTIQGTVFCITVIFQCRPPSDYWAVTIGPQPNCINQSGSLLVAGIINTLTDFLAVLLPIRTVWTLQLPKRQAAIIILLFGCGFISCCAGIVRTFYMWEVTKTWDQTWASYPVWLTSGIELYVGVICASIPATKAFFSTYIPTLFGSLSSIHSSSGRPSRQRSKRLRDSEEGVVISGGEEELVGFEMEKRREAGKEGSMATVSTEVVSRPPSESEYIRITQSVEQFSRPP